MLISILPTAKHLRRLILLCVTVALTGSYFKDRVLIDRMNSSSPATQWKLGEVLCEQHRRDFPGFQLGGSSDGQTPAHQGRLSVAISPGRITIACGQEGRCQTVVVQQADYQKQEAGEMSPASLPQIILYWF